MLNVEQLKYSINRMAPAQVLDAVVELRLEGLVTDERTPFGKVHFNTCFAEIEALFQRAGYHRPLDVVGYQGLVYALYDPSRWDAVQVLRWLKARSEMASEAG
ncbi:transcriptional regulator [Pseudomonas entomophila]|uniref:transcriptional regulator n=1 Tax=Pseudomonas entomophila TaxID=312306 RepID=UPI0023D7EDCC|nr:transcriptional regulator [Pseudomonas entomophila]MDF0732470.1 transcriptional regulator [Pseudomonas entomophila]